MGAGKVGSFKTMSWEEKALAIWELQGLELKMLGPSLWHASIPQTVVGLSYPGAIRVVNANGTSVPGAIEALWEEITNKLGPGEKLVVYNPVGPENMVRWDGSRWDSVS